MALASSNGDAKASRPSLARKLIKSTSKRKNMKKSIVSVMAIVALLGLNGCGGDDEGSTGGSAQSVLAGETLYSINSCSSSSSDGVLESESFTYEKKIYTNDTATTYEYSSSHELLDTDSFDYITISDSRNCIFTENSTSVTGVCDGEVNTMWKTLEDAKNNNTMNCDVSGLDSSLEPSTPTDGGELDSNDGDTELIPTDYGVGSAQSVLVGETLYRADSCDNSYDKNIYASETVTEYEYDASGELEYEDVSDVDYATDFSTCTFTENSSSVTGTCEDPTESGTAWKTLEGAKSNPEPCDNDYAKETSFNKRF